MHLVLFSSTIVVQGLAPGHVRIEVERGGKRVAFAAGTARSSSLTLGLELPSPAEDGRNIVLPEDRVTLSTSTTTTPVVVPWMIADIDADSNVIAAIVPDDLAAMVVLHDGVGRELLRESLPAGASSPRLLMPPVDIGPEHTGYVDVQVLPDVVVRARFAFIQLDIDVASGTIRGRSSPGAWLTITGRDEAGRIRRHLVQDGLYDNSAVVTGGAAWTARLAIAGDPQGTFNMAGATITIRREDFIVPGADPERVYHVPSITVSGPIGATRLITGIAMPSTEVVLVRRPLFGPESQTSVAAETDGTWAAELMMRPGDRASIVLVVSDGQLVTFTVAPTHAFVAPSTPSMMFVTDTAIRASAHLSDADGQEIANLAADIGDGWGRGGFVAGRNTFDVTTGMRIQLGWDASLTEALSIPAVSVMVSESGERLDGMLWPSATATVYQWQPSGTGGIADVTADSTGRFSVVLQGPVFNHDVRGAVVVHVSDQLSLLAGWARPEPTVDLFDDAVRMLAPVGAVHTFALATQRDGQHREVEATVMPPRGTAARQWLSPSRLPLRTAVVQFVLEDGTPIKLVPGDRISLPSEAIEIVLSPLRATLGYDGRVEVLAEGSDRVEVVLTGQSGEELARRRAEPVQPTGRFAVDIADLLLLHPADAVNVEAFLSRARIRSIGWKNTIEVGLHSGRVHGFALPGSTVRIAVSSDGAEIGSAVAHADGVGAYSGWLAVPTGAVVLPSAGMSLTTAFEGIRTPSVLSVLVPELTAAIAPGADTVRGRGPAEAELEIGATYERGRVVFGTLAGVADPGGGGRATAIVNPDGSYESVLVSQSAKLFRAGPGVHLAVAYDAQPGVRFYREGVLPLLGVEVDGSRVRLVGRAGEDVAFELREGPDGVILAGARSRTDGEGFAEALWSMGGSTARSRAGSLARAGGATPVVETVLPVHVEADWEADVLQVVAPAGRAVHSASGRCLPWSERQEGLEPVPGSDRGANVIPIRVSEPGQYYVGGVFGPAGHFLFDEAIRPLLIVDGDAGVVRGCASPYTQVDLRIRDEGGDTWAIGQGEATPSGWYEVAVTRDGRSVPIRRTDTVEATVEGVSVEHSAREPFDVDITDDTARVTATAGQSAVVIADLGAGYRERVASTVVEMSGVAELPLAQEVDGQPIRRWLIVVESAFGEGHFAGTIIERPAPARRVWLPLTQRPP